MSDLSEIDQVFAQPLSDIKAFEFNEAVTRVFRDMIARSVPGYELLLRIIGLYANIFIQENSNVYDLGCSLGDVTHLIKKQAVVNNFLMIAVDNSAPMIEQCGLNHTDESIDWRCDDIQNIVIENASMVVLNLTLQFIDPHERQPLLRRIFAGLNQNGALVLSEKINLNQTKYNQRMIQLHQAFKKMQGYSELEISQKRSALDNVLIPDYESQLRQRLQQVGFTEIYECFRCFNFVSYLAIKS